MPAAGCRKSRGKYIVTGDDAMAQRATINTVALRAGVSRGTVDRVLNQRPHVKPDIYEKVVRAMKELDYVPPTEQQAKALGLTLPALEHFRIGILLPSERGHFRHEILRGIEDAREYLHAYSVEVLTEECETDLPSETVAHIDSLLDKGAAGIALCAKEHNSIILKINALQEQGVPVVTYNSDIGDSKRLCFIGQDLVRGGRVAGELMSHYLHPSDHLLIAVGNPEFQAHRLRLQGFCERLYENGFHGESLRLIETYNDYALTYQKVSEALRDDPSLHGIYMANHSVTGCAEAIRDAGQKGQIHVISHDLTEETKCLLQRGEIDLSIAQNLYQQSYRALIVLQEYLQKHIQPQQELPLIQIICAENMEGWG